MIEWTWLAISVFAGIVTVGNLWEARSRQADLEGSGLVRSVVAGANVRREVVRFVSIAGCIGIVIPALLREGDSPLSIWVVVAMAIPVSIALNSYLDRRTRRTVDRLLAAVPTP